MNELARKTRKSLVTYVDVTIGQPVKNIRDNKPAKPNNSIKRSSSSLTRTILNRKKYSSPEYGSMPALDNLRYRYLRSLNPNYNFA